MIRLLHIGKYYSPFQGGIENFTRDLVESKPYQEQVETLLLVHQDKSGVATTDEYMHGVRVVKVRRQGVLLFAPICLSFLKKLRQLLREFKPDVIHIHMPNLSAFACLLSQEARNIPWVIHWHSDVLGQKPDWRIRLAYKGYKTFERLLLTKSAKIIATSPTYLEGSNVLQEHAKKCQVIPLGIRRVPSIKRRKENEIEDGTLHLLIIGRLTYYKGHEYLIRALSQQNFKLKIVGKGELDTKLKTLVKQLGIENRVQFLGCINENELTREIHNCDLLCLPSVEKTEAFGVVLLEAARLSRPSLVTSVKGSGMAWVVEHNKTGLVVPPCDEKAIAKQLERVNLNRTLLDTMGDAAKLRFEELFVIDSVANEVIRVYKQVMS